MEKSALWKGGQGACAVGSGSAAGLSVQGLGCYISPLSREPANPGFHLKSTKLKRNFNRGKKQPTN